MTFDPKNVDRFNVFRGHTLVGELQRDQHRGSKSEVRLVFNESFLNDAHVTKLSYRIAKSTSPLTLHGDNLPAYFAGLLPEGMRLRALVSKIKTSESDMFSLLAATGANTVGDIYTSVDGRRDDEVWIDQPDDFFATLSRALEMNFGGDAIAGVQEKISASMISFPTRKVGSKKAYILKLNPADKPHLVDNELAILLLAKRCGVNVNRAKLVLDKVGNRGLLVERFDRMQGADENIVMLHQEDACQFLNRYPADKYRISMREIAEAIQELSTAPLIDILKVIRLYAFSYLVGNGDLHAKNISLQTLPNGRIQLTPAYDLICTRVYGDESMALKIEGRDKNIKRRDILAFATRFGLREKAVLMMLDKLTKRFSKAMHRGFTFAGLDEKGRTLIETMAAKRIEHLSE